jgi:hypothetical protein
MTMVITSGKARRDLNSKRKYGKPSIRIIPAACDHAEASASHARNTQLRRRPQRRCAVWLLLRPDVFFDGLKSVPNPESIRPSRLESSGVQEEEPARAGDTVLNHCPCASRALVIKDRKGARKFMSIMST